jgi:hypothetical protein
MHPFFDKPVMPYLRTDKDEPERQSRNQQRKENHQPYRLLLPWLWLFIRDFVHVIVHDGTGSMVEQEMPRRIDV